MNLAADSKRYLFLMVFFVFLFLIGAIFVFNYWHKIIGSEEKNGISKEISQEEAMKKETGEIIPEANYPAGGEKEIFLEPEREGGEKPNIE